MESTISLTGALRARRITPPGPGLLWKLKNFPRLVPGLWHASVAQFLGIPTVYGRLYARKFGVDGHVVDYGLISTRLVTTAFVNFMVAQLQTETSEWGDFKYHDSGTGIVSADVGNTGLGTPWGGARTVGTQVEGASANIYESVATTAYNDTFAITEHGLFSQAAGTTLMDRHVFAAINVVNGDSISFTYELTCTAGG